MMNARVEWTGETGNYLTNKDFDKNNNRGLPPDVPLTNFRNDGPWQPVAKKEWQDFLSSRHPAAMVVRDPRLHLEQLWHVGCRSSTIVSHQRHLSQLRYRRLCVSPRASSFLRSRSRACFTTPRRTSPAFAMLSSGCRQRGLRAADCGLKSLDRLLTTTRTRSCVRRWIAASASVASNSSPCLPGFPAPSPGNQGTAFFNERRESRRRRDRGSCQERFRPACFQPRRETLA